MECNVDTDFVGGWQQVDANDADNVMSQTGFVILYVNCPLLWSSKLQTEIPLSTAESEIISLSSALREVIPLMTLMEEINEIFPFYISNPNFMCTVHEDNQSCIRMATVTILSPRTKHIALKYHNFKSNINKGQIKIECISADMQKADILKKPLADDIFSPLRHILCVWK